MSRVLGVGIATLDVICEVDGYPAEDAELRALARYETRGGNVTNTLVVLAGLGRQAHWAGTLAKDPGGEAILADLARQGVVWRGVRMPGVTPTSYVTLNRRNGSRTIVHYRDLPEYPARAFQALDLEGVDWVHFEGRNVDETARMLDWLGRRHPHIRRSLEVEKPRPGIEALFPRAQVLLFSRGYARARGLDDPRTLFASLPPGQELYCGWGAAGAALRTPDGADTFLDAPRLVRVVDTLGAGDVLNAGIIYGRLGGVSPEVALRQAMALAAAKCGQRGLSGLRWS